MTGTERTIPARGRRLATATLVLMLTTNLAGITVASGEEKDLTVLGLEVHLNNMRGLGFAKGGYDNLADFEKSENAKVTYVTGTTTSLQEALTRLGTLSSTKEDVIYVNQLDANKRLTTYLAPLTPDVTTRKIEGFPDRWPAGVIASATFDGKLYLLPLRCGTFTLWYNDRIFSDLGIAGPPTTPDELYEIAKKGTFTRPNGEKVFGFLPRGDKWSLTEDMTVLARMYGGDLISQDFDVGFNKPPAVAAVKLLQRMYKEGLMPPNWTSIDGNSQAEFFRSERVTMVIGGANYDSQYNKTGDSKIAGHAIPAHMPLIAELKTPQVSYSPSTIWYWGVGVLAGSQNKPLAYDFVEHIAEPKAQAELAANGNGPCTSDVLAEMAKTSPGMKLAQQIFAISRPTVPAHPNMNQVRDIMGETVQNIVVNNLDAQAELDKAAARIKRLLN
jgi:multiple sugar transport system substrate-binding protein